LKCGSEGVVADMAEDGGSPELTVKQEALIAALLAGHSLQLSAKVASVSERTAQRWLTLPHFKAAYKAAHCRVFDLALQKLMLVAEKAVDALTRNLDGEGVQPSTQIRVAQVILDVGLRSAKVQELEKLLADLETRLQDE
jgi:hypothetical protein